MSLALEGRTPSLQVESSSGRRVLDQNGISTAGETDVTPNVRCGVRFSVKISPALQCGPAAPTLHPMMMSTTPATHSCSNFPTHLPPPPCSRSWMSSWWPCRVGSPLTFSPLHRDTTLLPDPTFWLTIRGTASGSESRPWPGS